GEALIVVLIPWSPRLRLDADSETKFLKLRLHHLGLRPGTTAIIDVVNEECKLFAVTFSDTIARGRFPPRLFQELPCLFNIMRIEGTQRWVIHHAHGEGRIRHFTGTLEQGLH